MENLETIFAGSVFPVGFGLGHCAALDVVGTAQAGAAFGRMVYFPAGRPIDGGGDWLLRGGGLRRGIGRSGGGRGGGRLRFGGRFRGGSGVRGGQQLRFDQHLFRVVKDSRDLGAGGSALGV